MLSGEERMRWDLPSTVVRETFSVIVRQNHCYSLRKQLDDTNILTHA